MLFTLLLFIASSSACKACSEHFRRMRLLGFDADDPENKLHIGRIISHIAPLVLADDEAAALDDGQINWGEITKIAGQVNQIGKVLGFDANEEKKSPDSTESSSFDRLMAMYAHNAEMQRKYPWRKPKIICAPSRFPSSLEYSTSDVDELDDGINWGEITKIAGQVSQIGQVLGFDTEDEKKQSARRPDLTPEQEAQLDAFTQIIRQLPLNHALMRESERKHQRQRHRHVLPRPRKVTHLNKTALNDDDLANEYGGMGSAMGAIGNALGYDADELSNFVSTNGPRDPLLRYSAADEVEDGINWGEITKIAGQVNQIGQILGFDGEDLDDWSVSVGGGVSVSSNEDLENSGMERLFRGKSRLGRVRPVMGSDDLENGFWKKIQEARQKNWPQCSP